MNVQNLLKAYGTWALERQAEGYDAFLMSFMFSHIRGSQISIAKEMEAAISRLYSQTLTRIVRKPGAHRGKEGWPLWIVVPDYPRSTGFKLSRADVTINGGRHMHGITMIPQRSRLRSRFDLHLKEHQELYLRPPLLRIDAQLITYRTLYTSDYGMKGLKRPDISSDDILILPSC